MHSKKKLILTFLSLALPASTWATTRAVSNAGVIPGCAATFTTIQAAITASSPNDVVYVCNTGVPFNEQVVISKTITLAGQPGAEIQPNPLAANTNSLTSGNPIAAAIWVTPGTTGVIISGLIVDGSLNGISGCLPNPVGIYYQNASGTVAHNAVRNFTLGSGLEGCQAGIGIFAQADDSGGTSTVLAYANSVHDFQKTGIVGNEIGTTLTATANIVTGLGPSPNIAQNGIQIGFGATGTIAGNTVSNVSYSLCTSVANCAGGSATGILLYDPSGAIATHTNNVSSTQGAVVYISVNNGSITGNVISNSIVFDGIDIDTDGSSPGTGNTVSSNTVMNSSESSVYVNTAGNSVINNTFVEAPIGIWFVAAGNSQSGNKFYDIPLSVQSGSGPAAAVSRRPSPQPAR